MEYNRLLQDIQARKFAPLYYLQGEETYFIDKVVEALDADGAVLQDAERSFNRELFYGPDAKAAAVANACRSFPMLAERRLVILKEAHRMPKPELEKLHPYFKQPVASTVLAMAFKDKTGGLPKGLVDEIGKRGVVFQPKKFYERDVQQWVAQMIRAAGYEADNSLPALLVEHLGTNLGLIENELDKMFIGLRSRGEQRLSREYVFEMVNIDKEFNVFELNHALAERHSYRAHLIIDRLTQNTKLNPPVLIVGGLFRFFHGIALVHQYNLHDANAIKNQLNVNYYQAQDLAQASKRYPAWQVYRNIGYIQEADLRLKGVVPTQMDESHVLKTLVWQMLQ
ncbi:MAG: DNA polymerase III subunit delta [Bacteroidia bacterium]